MRHRAALTVAVLALAAFVAVRAQTPLVPSLDILSPATDAYVSGTTMLRASLTPADTATRVTFSVDGKQVCDASAPPFECSWEAGANIVAHQFRVVADLKGGGR